MILMSEFVFRTRYFCRSPFPPAGKYRLKGVCSCGQVYGLALYGTYVSPFYYILKSRKMCKENERLMFRCVAWMMEFSRGGGELEEQVYRLYLCGGG